MGCSSNTNVNVNTNNNSDEIDISKIVKVNKKQLYKLCKSICSIVTPNIIVTGFLIILYRGDKPLLCLICNGYEIQEEIEKSKEKIEVYYDNEQKKIKIYLDKNKRFIKGYKDIDMTIVEILSEDNIGADYFLVPNLDYINAIINLRNKNIYIPQFPKEGLYSFYYGEIKEINDYQFKHDQCLNIQAYGKIKSGTTGFPVFLDDSTEVIGIYKQGNQKDEKFGFFIYLIIQLIQECICYKKKKYGKCTYEGYLFNNKRDGKGKFTYENGDYFIGNWHKGLRNGKGKLYNKNGSLIFEGNFVNDQMEGNGKYIYPTGEYYIGEWLDNREHGKGAIYYRNGSIKYEGDFVFGKFEGFGKFIYKDGDYFIGNWSNGEKHENGTEYYKNGNIKFEGNFVNGKIQGKGKYFYENGDYFIGYYNDGIKIEGTEYYRNGKIKYEGNYVDDKYEGKGKLVSENGDYYIGKFLKGCKHGKGKEYYSDGSIKFNAVYKNNVLIKQY